jgi:phytoene dehydrogenase-like protein
MMKRYDAIVIGAGHNGLTCACYLAKSGMSVLVVERNTEIGGMTSTRELVLPGFHTDIHASGYQLANLSSAPDELRLADFGLDLIRPDVSLSKAFADHSCLAIMANIKDTHASIAQYSRRDADTWEALFADYLSHKDALKRDLESRPRSSGAILTKLESEPGGAPLIRFRTQSVRSWAGETFESEQMRCLMADFAAHAGLAPDDAGGAEFAYLFLSVIQDAGNRAVKGGMGRLPAALHECLEQHGGAIRTSAPVAQIRVENGTAIGVLLTDGSLIPGGCVVSSAHPQHLILELLSEAGLEKRIVDDIKKYEHDGSLMGIYIALSGPVTFAAGEAASRAMQVQVMPDTMDELAQAFCDLRANRLPERPSAVVVNEASADPGRVPEGKSSLKVILTTVPYEIDWRAARTGYAQSVIDQLAAGPIPDLKEKIITTVIMSPADYEADLVSAIRGTSAHGAMVPYQQGAMRPIFAMGQYRGPVGNLYLCGAGSHPGPGVSMMPGRNAAQVVLGDLRRK